MLYPKSDCNMNMLSLDHSILRGLLARQAGNLVIYRAYTGILMWDPEAILYSSVKFMALATSFSSAAIMKCKASALRTSFHLTLLHLSHCKEIEGPHVSELGQDLFMCTYQKAYTPVWMSILLRNQFHQWKPSRFLLKSELCYLVCLLMDLFPGMPHTAM